jgi:DNA-directed RNA polymerase specialized sigma24 family protein
MRSTTDQDSHARPAGPWLLQQHRLFIARYAARLGRGVAEDLASEAIARSLRHPAPDGRHGPWLERVFQNLMVDHLRRRARSHQLQATETSIDNPEQRAAEHQLRRRLAALWPQLRPEWQQALASSFGGQDRARTAAADLAPATVRTRTFRALRVLRRALGVARGWLPLPTSLSMSAQLQPLAAGLLPAAIAVTGLVSPAPALDRHPMAAPPHRAVAQVVPRRTPAAPPATLPSPGPARAPARIRPPARPQAPAPDEPPKAIQHFDFDNDQVVGDLQRPDGIDVDGPAARADHRSLIEIPGSFIGPLVRTLEDL